MVIDAAGVWLLQYWQKLNNISMMIQPKWTMVVLYGWNQLTVGDLVIQFTLQYSLLWDSEMQEKSWVRSQANDQHYVWQW